jgi:hypothetical protein
MSTGLQGTGEGTIGPSEDCQNIAGVQAMAVYVIRNGRIHVRLHIVEPVAGSSNCTSTNRSRERLVHLRAFLGGVVTGQVLTRAG